MALVPYARNGYLPMFHEATRCFTYANRSIEIVQNWADSGVAGVVWDAAIVLATFLQSLSNLDQEQPNLGLSVGPDRNAIKGKNVLELGAGTGLVGMVAWLLGANVVITDTQEALNFTKENVNKNIGNASQQTPCEVKELHWGKDLDKWKGTSWDFILGADIVYVEDTFQELFETLMVLTESNKNAHIFLSCRIRYQRDLNFLDLLRTEFSVLEIRYDKEHDVKIFQATRL